MANKVIGPKVDRNLDNPEMAWISLEKRLKALEEGGGGGGYSSLTIGPGLAVVNGAITVHTTSNTDGQSTLPFSSDGLFETFGKVETLLDRV